MFEYIVIVSLTIWLKYKARCHMRTVLDLPVYLNGTGVYVLVHPTNRFPFY